MMCKGFSDIHVQWFTPNFQVKARFNPYHYTVIYCVINQGNTLKPRYTMSFYSGICGINHGIKTITQYVSHFTVIHRGINHGTK